MLLSLAHLLELTLQATTTTYTADDMCESPAIDYGYLDPGALNTVDMTKYVPPLCYSLF